MRRANRPIALVLLVMAVLCSPAGVCVVDGMATTVHAAAPALAHPCSRSGGGPVLAASDSSCCSEPRTGLVNVLRFTLQKQAPPSLLDIADSWTPKTFVTDRVACDRRAPLVLRI